MHGHRFLLVPWAIIGVDNVGWRSVVVINQWPRGSVGVRTWNATSRGPFLLAPWQTQLGGSFRTESPTGSMFYRLYILDILVRRMVSLSKWEAPRLWRRNVVACGVGIWLMRCMDETSQELHTEVAWLRAMYAAWESGILLENVLQKMFRTCSVLYILTWKCASRHSGVQFFHIATSKSGPRPSVFYDFDLKMCFAPQRRAIFPHRNFKKWSETVSFLRFWLENVLRATAPCNFSTSELQKVVRDRQFFTI